MLLLGVSLELFLLPENPYWGLAIIGISLFTLLYVLVLFKWRQNLRRNKLRILRLLPDITVVTVDKIKINNVEEKVIDARVEEIERRQSSECRIYRSNGPVYGSTELTPPLSEGAQSPIDPHSIKNSKIPVMSFSEIPANVVGQIATGSKIKVSSRRDIVADAMDSESRIFQFDSGYYYANSPKFDSAMKEIGFNGFHENRKETDKREFLIKLREGSLTSQQSQPIPLFEISKEQPPLPEPPYTLNLSAYKSFYWSNAT